MINKSINNSLSQPNRPIYRSAKFARSRGRFNLVRANLAQSDLLEDLPVSLTYDIAKPSAESTPLAYFSLSSSINNSLISTSRTSHILPIVSR